MADLVAAPARRRLPVRRLESAEGLLLSALAIYVFALVVLPLGRLFVEGLRPDAEGLFLGVLRDVWSQRAVGRALSNTLVAACGATLISLALGVAFGLLLKLTDLPGRGVLMFLALLPMLIPPQISALSWIELMGPASPILLPLGLAPPTGQTSPIYSMAGIIWVMGLEHMPLVLLSVAAGIAAMPSDLVEAARTVGARPPRIALSVILPAILPSVLAGTALAFVSAIGNFGVPALLGIPGRVTLLTTLIYQRLNGFGPSILGEVAATAMILVALAIVALAIHALLRRRSAHLDRTALPAAPFRLKAWRWPVTAITWALLIVMSVLPLLALVGSALVPAVGMRLGLETISLDNFERLLIGNSAVERAFVNSLCLAGLAALISLAVALPLAYFAVIRRAPLARLLDLAAEAPYAVPGTVLALGIIIVFLPPLPLFGLSVYGSFAILLIAYLARFLLLVLRPVAAAAQALDPALDEAGRIVGARPVRRLVSIVAPAILPAGMAGALLIFMAAFNELTVSALLWSTGNETLGVLVFQLQYEGNSPAAAVLAALVVAATLLLAALLGAIGRRWAPGVVPWQV